MRVARTFAVAIVCFVAFSVATAPAAAAVGTVERLNTTSDFQQGQFTNTTATNDHVQLAAGAADSYTQPDGGSGRAETGRFGILVTAETAGEASFTLYDYSDIDGGTTRVVNNATGETILSTSANGGETVTVFLSPGTYRVTHDAGPIGDSLFANYPVNIDGLTVEGGIEPGKTNGIEWWNYETVEFAPVASNGSYTSPEISLEDASGVEIDQTTAGGTLTHEIQYQTESGTWKTYATNTSNAETVVTSIDATTAESYQTWRVKTNFSLSGDATSLSVDEIRFQVETSAPSVSLVEPGDGAAVYESPVELTAAVSDPDFGRVQNDSLTVEFRDGSGATIATETLTSNGTVNATYSDPVAGRNDWSVTVTDAYENTATAGPIAFRTPAELEIRDEQNPGTLITNPGSAEVRFYTDSDQVYTRSPDNGTISLAGLPADETFVAAVSVEGYNTRTITIDSLLEQQTAYLLDENATVAEVDFELNDQTNQFPTEQTTLFVQRAITRNNSTSWRTIVGERFGATGTVPTTLASGDRYRLKVRNQDGDMRALGSYVAAGAAVEPLRIGQVTFQGAQDSGASFSSRFDSTSESEAVDLRYVDPNGDTDELNVTVRRQDANNTVVFEDSISGPITTYRERIPTSSLPGHSEDSSYQVEYSASRAGSAVPISGNRTIGDVPSVGGDWPVDPQFLNIAGYLTVLAMFGAVVILSPRHAGLVGSATAFALSIMGVIAINSLVLSFALVVSGLFAVGGDG